MRAEAKIVLSISFLFLSACANKEPVQKFATSTEEFLTTFDSFASRAKATCQMKYIYMDLDASKDYIGDPNDAAYIRECRDYDQSYKALKIYSSVVSTYAASLGKLAGVERSVFSNDIDSVSSQLEKWKVSGGSEVNAETVSAATKLIKSAAEVVTGFMVDSKIKKELRDNHADLTVVLNDMKRFANEIQAKNLDMARKYADSPLEQLKKLSYIPDYEVDGDQFTDILASGTRSKQPADALGARLPYRMLQVELYKNIALIDQERKALKSFDASCDALLQAHKDLRDNYGKINEKEMLKKIKEFYDAVKEARENFIVLNS
ncbi:hypothetical protein [Stutzerimonas kunmingensis]|uniref:hypothetical protein n=1 Tax=Stutzerimonas kunmingensis TaxID=1211807 RepID=UPI00241BF11B|nr:hypothetical protein [Stutzerimonas kunmingensis]